MANLGSKNILGLIAVGLGGYILYKKATEPDWDIGSLFDFSWLKGGGSSEVVTEPAVNQAGQPTVATTPVTTTIPVETTTPTLLAATPTQIPALDFNLMQQTVALAKNALPTSWDGKLTADEWNYFYSIASGVTQTTDLFTAGMRSEKITANEYAARRQSKGLSGLGAIRFRDIPGIIRSGGASGYELAKKRQIS